MLDKENLDARDLAAVRRIAADPRRSKAQRKIAARLAAELDPQSGAILAAAVAALGGVADAADVVGVSRAHVENMLRPSAPLCWRLFSKLVEAAKGRGVDLGAEGAP